MGDIELTGPDGHSFSAYRADPAGPAVDGVVVIQEIFGVNRHIRSVADRFAAEGFVAVAPALFDRVERGVELEYDMDSAIKGVGIAWEQLPLDDALADATAALDALADELGGPGRVGAVGFCFGGMLAAALASRAADHLGAAVGYYPSRAAKLLVDDVGGAPLMLQLGEQDESITAEDRQTLAERWPEATLHLYAGAGHGFNCDLRDDGFDPDASALAWGRTIGFLSDRLGPSAP
ncbi:MAG: dienelactone hydrolase family protein [Acidimicrobiales bacterium]